MCIVQTVIKDPRDYGPKDFGKTPFSEAYKCVLIGAIFLPEISLDCPFKPRFNLQLLDTATIHWIQANTECR
jgi:hypothetical protein